MIINHLFKQIIVIVFIFLILAFLTYFIIKYILILNHKFFIDPGIIKYPLNQNDKDYFKKYSKKIKIFDKKNCFITKTKWSTKNNNYILFKNNYYIIEPGYYYILNKECELFFNKNIFVYNV